MEENVFRAAIVAALALIAAYLGQLIVPLAFLILMMVLDYVTGMAAAWITHTLNSRVGIMGIIKKLLYLVIVCVGCVIDYLISLIGSEVGLEPSAARHYIGLLVIIWLITNEGISILENLAECGLPQPPFIGKLLAHLRSTTESQAPAVPDPPPAQLPEELPEDPKDPDDPEE